MIYLRKFALNTNSGKHKISSTVENEQAVLIHELSLIWGPVQNQILQFRGCSYAGRLGHSALLAKAYQGNTLDIGLDTFPSLVSISQVGECITKTLQKPPSSRHALCYYIHPLYDNIKYNSSPPTHTIISQTYNPPPASYTIISPAFKPRRPLDRNT